MNRRALLKGVLGIGAVGIAGRSIAEDDTPTHHPDGESYHDKYWGAQSHIDLLESENRDQYNSTLQFHDTEGGYAEMYHDGTDLVIENKVTGKVLRV